jgi:ATP-dependent helicase/nuclease subunit A
VEPAAALRPSYAVPHRGPGRRAGSAPAEARLRGSLVHALIERLPSLPADRRRTAAEAYVRARAPKLGAPERSVIVANAIGVLGHEALAALLGPGSRAEVGIAGTLVIGGETTWVSGQIDRLAVLDGEVLLADFKSDARVPGPARPAPAAYAAQLALYRLLLQQIYPGRRIRPFLVWTAGPSIQELRSEDLDRALDRVTAT